nr:hypothetical protein [candidate division KSB1 bacterium]NIV05173.1 hypothetical protein [candidate division Zixibacteria bacterium]NIS23235.1 hypothetical protein [candidate division KSB1 bacterium]NIT70113.1 hypothetical protein [candidate division KSB1 bacterium]NIU23773.1 hypothetical protein [candidate division KSB1 bacterium]
TKGSAVMNMLRFELGDELFRKGIRKYVHDYQYQNVVSEDLRKTMEAVSGRDLTQFFKQWVYSAGLPEFKVWWEWNEDAGQMTLYVHQTQDSLPAMDVFKLTVPIEITAGKQLLQERIQLNQREHRFKYALKQKPDMVRFDKGPWILKKLNFEKSFAELKYQLHFDSDVTGRYMAAEQLAYYGDRAIPELKRAIIREPFYWVRKRLVTTLGAIGSSEALDVLKIATEDKDARVREEVMKQLSGFKAEAVQDILYTHLEHDVNDYVRGEAAASLGKVKAENAFDVLKEMLAEDSHRNIIRRGVFRAMKALDDGRALPLAQKYVHYRYSNGGMHLLDMAILDYAESMTYNHQREGLEVIKNALKNPYFRTRKRAAKLLSNYEATETLLLLKNILKSERRNFVRPTLENAIDALSELSSQ